MIDVIKKEDDDDKDPWKGEKEIRKEIKMRMKFAFKMWKAIAWLIV